MENLKKKAKCWLVPTENKENSIIKFGCSLRKELENLSEMTIQRNHLYITSDEEIEEGNICLNIETNTTFKTHKHGLPTSSRNKKIIISTDKSLNLPQPSQGFINAYIEAYNRDEQIVDVNVEYKKELKKVDINFSDIFDTVKTDSNNCATITKIKDSWNREEIGKIIHDCMILANATNDIGRLQKFIDKWIENNL